MKKKVLLTSILTIALCLSLIAGSTFALFTSESSVNIAVTAGKVNMIASVDEIETWSLEDDKTAAGRTDGSFTQGGSAKFADGVLTLDKIIPGDKVAFAITGTNESNVTIQYRVKIACTEGDLLMSGLKVTIGDETVTGLASYTSAWATLSAATDMNKVDVSIELPAEAGNEYQDLTTKISVLVEAIQGNAETTDESETVTLTVVKTDEELRAAMLNSGKVVLLNDIAVDADETILVASGKDTILDLNGHTLSSISDATGSNRNALDVRGTLTIMDGVVSTKHVGANMGWSNSTNVVNITAGGVLNVENAELVNLGGSDMAFGVHMNNWGEVTLNVDNSTITSTYCAVRVFNSGYDMNNVTITNSNLVAKMSVWVHNYTAADFGNYDADAIEARLNFNFIKAKADRTTGLAYNDTANLIDVGNVYTGSIRYGFTDAEIYYSTNVKAIAADRDQLQKSVDAATGEYVIYLIGDIDGDVTVTQKPDVEVTILGNGHTFDGTLTVDGKSARYDTAALTIKDLNFEAESLTGKNDAYISLGVSGNNNTRYTNHVTVDNCTFSGNDEKFVAIKSYTGGDKNLTINGCTVNAGMHSLVQVTNVEEGLTITNCNVYSKNGAGLNNTLSLEMSGCTFDVKGYAIRFGTSAAATVEKKIFNISNSTLKSACAESDDAVIVFRTSSTNAKLTLSNTTLTGNITYLGNTANTEIVG